MSQSSSHKINVINGKEKIGNSFENLRILILCGCEMKRKIK